MSTLLNKIKSPADLKVLKAKELEQLAGEIRQELIARVTNNGGHLASNLGVVELTIALHRVFNSPKDKIIWEAFYGNGDSGSHLTELGYNVIHEPRDFFTEPPDEWDIIVSNPPFSQSKEVLTKMLEYDKPFIMIMPSSKINTGYFRAWKDKGIQIIIPKKRIHFTKLVDGKVPDKWKNACNFDCFYYCYKIDLPKDIIWLD